MIAPICAELGESATDIAGMAMLGETAAKLNDGRAMLLLGKAAHSRGLPLDYYAFPTIGLPDYTPIAPPVEVGGDLFDCAAGKPLQSEGRFKRQSHGLHAGDAYCSEGHREEVQGDL